MTGPIHDRWRFQSDPGPAPSPIRIYPAYFTDAQEELLARIRHRDRALAAKRPVRRLTQLEQDRADLLYLLGSLRGEIERQRWMVELPTDIPPPGRPS